MIPARPAGVPGKGKGGIVWPAEGKSKGPKGSVALAVGIEPPQKVKPLAPAAKWAAGKAGQAIKPPHSVKVEGEPSGTSPSARPAAKPPPLKLGAKGTGQASIKAPAQVKVEAKPVPLKLGAKGFAAGVKRSREHVGEPMPKAKVPKTGHEQAAQNAPESGGKGGKCSATRSAPAVGYANRHNHEPQPPLGSPRGPPTGAWGRPPQPATVAFAAPAKAPLTSAGRHDGGGKGATIRPLGTPGQGKAPPWQNAPRPGATPSVTVQAGQACAVASGAKGDQVKAGKGRVGDPGKGAHAQDGSRKKPWAGSDKGSDDPGDHGAFGSGHGSRGFNADKSYTGSADSGRGGQSQAAKVRDRTALERVLSPANLRAFADALVKLGVELPSDLRYVTPDDMNNMNMSVIQRRKLTEVAQAHSGEGGATGSCASNYSGGGASPNPKTKFWGDASFKSRDGKGSQQSKGDRDQEMADGSISFDNKWSAQYDHTRGHDRGARVHGDGSGYGASGREAGKGRSALEKSSWRHDGSALGSTTPAGGSADGGKRGRRGQYRKW